MRILQNTTLTLSILVGVYALTRLLSLTVLPIFTDESIYIYWAKVIESTHSQWFISLTDGKPPLLIWITALLLSIVPNDWYLIAGRLPAVFAGAVSVIMIYKLTELLFEKKSAATLAAVLYIISPFTLLYDRMALFDPLLQATLLSAAFFAIKTFKNPSLQYAIGWGISLGLAFLSKPTALLFLVFLPFGIFLFSGKPLKKSWKKLAGFSVIAVLIAEIINNLQRVSSVYFMAAQKNAQFQQPIDELLKNPFALTIGNMQGFINWIIGFYTVPFLLLGLVGFAVLMVRNIKIGIFLSTLWLLPIIALATVGREIFPRYILFTTPYFLIATAWILIYLYSIARQYKFIVILLGAAVVLPLLVTDYYLLTRPERASLPQTDYDQLVGSHPSGYGVDQVYAYVDGIVKEKKQVTLVTQGTFGLYPYAFSLEYWDNTNVTILPRWPLSEIDSEIIQAQQNSEVVVILKEHEEIPEGLPLQLIKKIEKPGGKFPILITKLQQE